MANSWAFLNPRKPDLPMHAGATDVINDAPVKIVAGVWTVQACATSSDEPIGITRASAPATHSVAVRDRGEIVRAFAGATVKAGDQIGIVGVGATAGASGNIVVPQLGPVAKATGVAVWAVGRALEPANPEQGFAFLVDPKQLSGLN